MMGCRQPTEPSAAHPLRDLAPVCLPAGITLVSVGHRPTLLAFHEEVLLLQVCC